MTNYGRSPWVETHPKSRVPAHPRHRGTESSPVVIVGGGLTGCATAYAFAAAGQKVVLLEAERIGLGSTAASLGLVAGEPGVALGEVEKAVGRKDARAAFLAWRRSALDFQALLRRLDIPCHLQAGGAATVAITPEQMTRLKKEQKARRDAGLDVPMLTAKAVKAEVALDAVGAVRDKDAAVLDPYRACLGLAAAAADRGATIFERSPVRRITFTRRHATVFSSGGAIKTSRVVIATGMPTKLFASLERHFWFRDVYFALTEPVPARIRQQLGRRTLVVRDLAPTPHIVRWFDDNRLLVGGADAPSPAARVGDKLVVQRTGQLMYELSTLYPDISGLQPAFGWHAAYARTTDGLPYIGPHRNFPHQLFAFGDSSHSVTGAYLASRVLLRHHLGELEPADTAFAFTRYER
jgi:glycine/D-amino acid oxidase-like deaminating enzyme